MAKFNFCEKCGAASRDEWNGTYDPMTGEKRMYSVCSADACHTLHDKASQPVFSRGDWKCRRCGEIGWYCFY